MAATTIRELLVKLGVEADTQEVADYDGKIEKVKGHLTDLVNVAKAVATGLAVLGAGLVAQAQATSEYARDVERSAGALGLTTDAYQELTYAAEKYGGEAKDVADVLGKVTMKAGEAAAGSEDAAKLFASIGVSVDALKKASPEGQLRLVAAGLAATKDPSKRMTAAIQILGDEMARKFLPLLSQGTAGLDALGNEAQSLGVVMSEEAIRKAKEFSTQTSILGAVVTALRNELGLALIPTLSRLVSQFLSWVEANRAAIDQGIDEWAGRVTDAIDDLAAAVKLANTAAQDVGGWSRLLAVFSMLSGAAGAGYVAVKVGMLVVAVGQAAMAVAAAVGGFGMLGVVALVVVAAVGQLVFVVSQLAGMGLVIGDFVTYLQGGDSLWGRLIEKWRNTPGILGAIARYMEALGNVGRAVAGVLGAAWNAVAAALAPVLGLAERFGTVVIDALVAGLDRLVPYIDRASAALNQLAGFLGAPAAAQGAAAGVAGMPSPGIPAGTLQNAAQSYQAFQSFAPSGTPGTSPYAGAAKSLTMTGDQITINGMGITAKEAEEILERRLAAKQRLAAAALAGAEV